MAADETMAGASSNQHPKILLLLLLATHPGPNPFAKKHLREGGRGTDYSSSGAHRIPVDGFMLSTLLPYQLLPPRSCSRDAAAPTARDASLLCCCLLAYAAAASCFSKQSNLFHNTWSSWLLAGREGAVLRAKPAPHHVGSSSSH